MGAGGKGSYHAERPCFGAGCRAASSRMFSSAARRCLVLAAAAAGWAVGTAASVAQRTRRAAGRNGRWMPGAAERGWGWESRKDMEEAWAVAAMVG